MPGTKQEFHLRAIDNHDAESKASLWLDDGASEEGEPAWGDDPCTALEQQEERNGANCFGQPIN